MTVSPVGGCGTTEGEPVGGGGAPGDEVIDTAIGVVEHVFAEDALRTIAGFRAQLYSAGFDDRRLSL